MQYTARVLMLAFFIVSIAVATEVIVNPTAIDPAIKYNATVNDNCIMCNNSMVALSEHVSTELVAQLTQLRRNIHQNAELSGNETVTARFVEEFVSQYKPDDFITNVGGSGMLFLFRLGTKDENRKTILFRADMDALPIQESTISAANKAESNYMSINPGVFHGCGHDGHTAIVAGLAPVTTLLRNKYVNNKAVNADVILLFQPAEETGAGATAMLKDPKYSSFANGIMSKIDTAFALHNLPGYDRNTILLKKGTFAAASKGVRIELKGETSHAAQPENGRSPAGAMATIVHKLEELANLGRKRQLKQYKDFILLTVVHAHLGTEQVAYGTTPGEARVMVTIRTYRDEDMSVLVEEVRQIVTDACETKKIGFDITFSDEFYATRNEDESTSDKDSVIEMVRQAAVQTNLKTQDMVEPFRWSEDFGNFQFKGSTYFGIGSGKDYPSLHNDDYDFLDDLIGPSLSVFTRLLDGLLNTKLHL